MQKLDDLNEEQKLAVETLEGPLLVIAGAGSGKTRVVTMRIARLIERGVPSSEIVALTFTNKAAEEMRSRVRAMVGSDLLACTFHSLGARILREYASEVGLDSSFTIYDEKDSENLLHSCFETLGMKDEKGLLKSVRHEISAAKNLIRLCEKPVCALYQERLRKYNAVDFDDLLYLTVRFFENSPRAEEVGNRFSYILVDEYQDTNHAQYRMCQFLSKRRRNICVVGDPDQSIYSWRGAEVQNILNFEKEFEGAKVITLNKNYRSTNTILKAASALIEHNQRPYNKELYSDLGDGEKVGLHIFPSDREEARFVIEKIGKYQLSYPRDQIAIFYRTNSQSRLFEDALLFKKIPYVIVGGVSFYMRKEIKDLLAFLRLAISPRDFMSLARTINIPRRGFGPKALQMLKEFSDQTGRPVLHLVSDMKLNATQRNNIGDYLSIIDDIKRISEGHSTLKEVIVYAIERTRYFAYLDEDPETAEERKENVEELISKGVEWSEGKTHEEARLKHFLEELTLKGNTEESVDDQKRVKLMTLHNGKGLEFEVCFIVGLEEELFPHANSFEEIEEERRLFYVGMTRAKRHLHLTSASYRFLWGAPRTMVPSRFLGEIPQAFTQRVQQVTHSYKPTPMIEPQKESREGRMVIHKQFGKGIIEKEYETSLGKTFDVKFFINGERRSLVEKFAKLTFV